MRKKREIEIYNKILEYKEILNGRGKYTEYTVIIL